jgi:hypothetical protein
MAHFIGNDGTLALTGEHVFMDFGFNAHHVLLINDAGSSIYYKWSSKGAEQELKMGEDFLPEDSHRVVANGIYLKGSGAGGQAYRLEAW